MSYSFLYNLFMDMKSSSSTKPMIWKTQQSLVVWLVTLVKLNSKWIQAFCRHDGGCCSY